MRARAGESRCGRLRLLCDSQKVRGFCGSPFAHLKSEAKSFLSKPSPPRPQCYEQVEALYT